MDLLKRSGENPILVPDSENPWEAEGAFNACPVRHLKKVHLLYRAASATDQTASGKPQSVSSIGYAQSSDGVHFRNRRQFIRPDKPWDCFGCEDPRVARFGGKYFIFYTALSVYPFRAEGIRVAVAVSSDLKKITAKHLVTPFNAKAMTLFPEKIDGKIAALLTVNTDQPPAKVCIAYFDRESDIWSRDYWMRWYASRDSHAIALNRSNEDHVEVGAPPIRTPQGWLVIHSYIQNYFSPPPVFGIEAVLLDLKNPQKIIARTPKPLLVPREAYELYGKVPNIVFPSGAYVKGDTLNLYYGAADTAVALASGSLRKLLKEMESTRAELLRLERHTVNPIIEPDPSHAWEAKATFNPAAVEIDGKVHLVYRAMSHENTSVMGYAAIASDGVSVSRKLPEPIYGPRADFEDKKVPGGNSGCEDPRLTRIGDTLYMCYTAYDGVNSPRVALTSIRIKDFLAGRWWWAPPVLISPPGQDDKDTALFPKKIKGKFAFLHRLGSSIWLDLTDDLSFGGKKWLKGTIIMNPRDGQRDSKRIGIAGPPIETEHGWLLLYHGISKKPDNHYHVRAALLDLKDPSRVIARTRDIEPLLEPEMPYEKEGVVPNVVFPCGAVVQRGILHVYYGGADRVVGVATMKMSELMEKLLASRTIRRK